MGRGDPRRYSHLKLFSDLFGGVPRRPDSYRDHLKISRQLAIDSRQMCSVMLFTFNKVCDLFRSLVFTRFEVIPGLTGF